MGEGTQHATQGLHEMGGVQLSLDFEDDAPVYNPDNTIGVYEHRSGDCDKHGVNVCFFRLYKSRGPHHCVACALEVLHASR